MTTPRCFLAPQDWQGVEVILPADESHYVTDVLRLAEGDAVDLLDGNGRVAEARIVSVPVSGRRKRGGDSAVPGVQIHIVRATIHPPPEPRVTLIQSLAKPARMDWLIEKATELGVGEILPVLTERVVVEAGAHKAERWERIALSAARQCGTPWVPRILRSCPFDAMLDRLPEFDLAVLGSLAPEARSFHELMELRRGKALRSVALLIGPEGDFTAAESASMIQRGAMPVSFGRLVLRVETAALFGLSVLLYELSREP